MDYNKGIQDFVHRTRENLDILTTNINTNGSGFEVTQLVNSFLGLLVILDETYDEMIRKVDLSSLDPSIWPIFGNVTKITSLEFKKTLHLIRNSFAHRNLIFDSACGELAGVYIENRNKHGEVSWRQKLTIEEMRFLFDHLCEIIIET